MGGRLGHEPETLHDLLRDEGIELHEIPRPGGKDHGGSRSKIYCPECGGGKQREKNFFVKIDPDGKGFRFICHRANSCGITGGRRLKGAGLLTQAAWTPKVYRRPKPPEEAPRPSKLLDYFMGFGISAATVAAFGVYRTTRRMAVLDATGKETGEVRVMPVLAYPYREDGALLNVKYKAVFPSGHKRFVQEQDAEPSLYNIDSFLRDDVGYFVEGEDDCLALYEAGFRQVTTIPDGTPPKLAPTYDPLTDTDARYEPVRGNPKLAKLARIVLAGDADAAGQRHHEELARRLGKERCWVVTWPEGIKDAKDCLQKRGRDAVQAVILAAKPYPIDGLEIVPDEPVRALYRGTGERRIITGLPALDERIKLTEAGQVIVCTGIPGHGKSAFWTAYAALVTQRENDRAAATMSTVPFHTCIFSAETRRPKVVADLVSHVTGKPFFASKTRQQMSEAEAFAAKHDFVDRHFSFVAWDVRGEQPTMRWVMDRFAASIRRHKTKLCILDPWQEVDDEMPHSWRKSPAEWIGKVLQRWVGFAADMKVNLVIIAHPPKPKERNKDGSYQIPGGYDIAGAQGFYSRCDVGMTIHRPNFDSDDMLLRVWKTKDQFTARVGDTMLRFDQPTRRILPKPTAVDELNPNNWRQEAHDESNIGG